MKELIQWSLSLAALVIPGLGDHFAFGLASWAFGVPACLVTFVGCRRLMQIDAGQSLAFGYWFNFVKPTLDWIKQQGPEPVVLSLEQRGAAAPLPHQARAIRLRVLLPSSLDTRSVDVHSIDRLDESVRALPASTLSMHGRRDVFVRVRSPNGHDDALTHIEDVPTTLRALVTYIDDKYGHEASPGVRNRTERSFVDGFAAALEDLYAKAVNQDPAYRGLLEVRRHEETVHEETV